MDSWPYGPRGHLRIQIQNHVGRLSISTHTLTPMQLHSTGVCIRAWYPPPPISRAPHLQQYGGQQAPVGA